jgi:hypothetical protein
LDGMFGGKGLAGGEYVVFTAVEVAEKRSRHWVRLPWCSSLRVGAVLVYEGEPADGAQANPASLRPALVKLVDEAGIVEADVEAADRIALAITIDMWGKEDTSQEFERCRDEEVGLAVLSGLMRAGP